MTLNLLLVADDGLVRAGLRALLEAQGDVSILAELSPEDDPGAFLDGVDALLWEGDEDALVRYVGDASPDGSPPLLALVTDEAEAVRALSAGASGVLYRTAPAERMVAALHAIRAGLTVLEPDVVEALPLSPARDFGTAPLDDLTPRELEVLNLLAEGSSNKAIARRLDISEHTVKFHVNAILGKFAAHTRTEAVAQAIKMGLVTL